MLPPRFAAAAATLVAAALLLTGCGGTGTTGSDALTFWVYEPNSKAQKDTLDALIAKFEKENDVDVKTTYIPKDGFNTKLNSSIAVGKNPDVSYLDQPLISKFADDGLLLDVTKDLSAGIGSDSFYPGAMDTATVDGTVYGVPVSMTTAALFYNKALVASPPTTWDEWVSSARKVYAPDQIAAFEGIGAGGYGAWLFPALVQSAGGAMVNEDATKTTFGEKPAIEAADLLVTLQGYSDQGIRQSQNAFGNGLIAYKISGPWDIEALQTNFPDLDFGVAPIPAKTGFDSISNIGGENLVIYKNSAKPDLAYKLVEYLTNPTGDAIMAGVTGNFATNIAAAESLDYTADPYLSAFATQLQTAVGRPTLNDWLKVNDEVIGAALDEILVSGGKPGEVLPAASKHADQILFG